ncbi:hypothetical protein [Corynebacterium cystitidis]|uniref:hypothetical protein n=2 Tax=Corynebacterium cystitidis TaxID=35757 RepID=UPI00211E5CEC|nr:hypothetical protein [Corynebacterium cystitidis]
MTLHSMNRTIVATLVVSALSISACSSNGTEERGQETSSTASETTSTSEPATVTEDQGQAETETEAVEVSSLSPRVILTHDKGLTTLDPETGEILEEIEKNAFLRLNQAGDGRHALVTEGNTLHAYDSGLIEKPHGDHSHFYETDPQLTNVTYDVPKAGHVVPHEGLTALFSDATGEVTVVKSHDIANSDAETVVFDTGDPHHGVAIALEDGSLIHTVGNEDERFTVRHSSAEGDTLAETTECPKVHGEAVSENGFAFGCADGPVLFKDGEFTKLHADGYQRSGTLAGVDFSPIVLADLKKDEDAEKEHPTSVALIDTAEESIREVELGSSYWFRSLGRGPSGEALVLTYDGNLTVIDQDSGEVTDRFPVIEPWEEKEEWQEPGPILKTAGGLAYITDAENQELVVVNLINGEVEQRHQLDFAAVEMVVIAD